mgnify:CR=1 FL=1|jgi:hypothetical protein
MAYVPIPKDLNRVKTKVAFNLTRRQLIGFSVAGLVGFPVYLFVRKFVPNDVAVIIMIVATLPIFFITMFEKDGLRFEQYFKYIYLHKLYQPNKRVRKEVLRGGQKTKKTRAKAQTKTKRPKGTKKKPETNREKSREKEE